MENTIHRFRHRHLKIIALFLAFITVLCFGLGKTAAYMLAKTPDVVNRFLSGFAPEGDLIISKQVDHPFGSDFTYPQDLKFTFEVDLGAENAGKQFPLGESGSATADHNGVLTVQVAPDSHIGISDLPVGNYTVKEVGLTKGFSVAPGPNGEDQTTRDIVIVGGKSASTTYVNQYRPEKADLSSLSLEGEILMRNRGWEDGDVIDLTLYYKEPGSDEWKQLSYQQILCLLLSDGITPQDPDFNKFSFTDALRGLTADKPGVWNFKLVQSGPLVEQSLVSPNAISFDILLCDPEMSGQLRICDIDLHDSDSLTQPEPGKIVATFENIFASAVATVNIQKSIETDSGVTKPLSGYVFELYEDGEVIFTSAPTNSSGETAITVPFFADEAGEIFEFILKEKDTGVPGMVYDPAAIELRVDVIGSGSAIEAYICHGNAHSNVQFTTGDLPSLDGVKLSSSINETFVNRYEPEPACVTVDGSKELTGRELAADEFDFVLYETDSTFTVGQNARPKAVTVNGYNDDNALFVFPELSFDKVGTYYFVVKEDPIRQLGGIIYDEKAYFLTVQVTDHPDRGELIAELTVSTQLQDNVPLVFRNSYRTEPFKIELFGKKEVLSADLTAGQFHFLLFNEQGEQLQRVSHDKDGNISFRTLSFEEEGEYVFTVQEDLSDPKENYIYDDSVFTVTITVTDGDNGQLVGEVSLLKNGKEANSLRFRNVYIPPDAPIDPEEPGEPGAPGDEDGQPDKESPDTSDRNDRAVSLGIMLIGMIGLAFTSVVFLKRRCLNGHRH